MSTSPKQYLLTFQKDSNEQVEVAAVSALAEHERCKATGLFFKQPEEKLVFLSRLGYPLWLIPRNDRGFIFDGENISTANVVYTEVPSAKQLMEKLELNTRPLENYLTFLSSYGDYFKKPLPTKQFTLKGVIGDIDFLNDFGIYSQETVELTDEKTSNLCLIKPSLDQQTITHILTEAYALQSTLKEEADNLPECIRLIKKTTNMHKTEMEYQAAAAKEEIDAKIKAQRELVNPQIDDLKKQSNLKIKATTKSFNKEIQSIQKLRLKTLKLISKTQKKINLYEKEAKAQEEKEHLIYEKRRRKKIKQANEQFNCLRKELKNQEGNIDRLSKEKVQEIYRLKFDHESEVKRVEQPILELEKDRTAKINYFRQQNLKIIDLETPVIEGLNRNLGTWDVIKAKFVNISIKKSFNTPVLFYPPFYLACFVMNENRRYLIIPPSKIGYEDFSTKLKGVLGMSKIKSLLNPRFKTITALLQNYQESIQQNQQLENQLFKLGEENNLLKNPVFQKNVEEGLTYLKKAGWLSNKEHQAVKG